LLQHSFLLPFSDAFINEKACSTEQEKEQKLCDSMLDLLLSSVILEPACRVEGDA
jgi:hypothetical protein